MKYVVLLRGVNVGGRTIKMAELRACFEAAGFGNVTTVLQTGNVVIDSDETDSDKLRQAVEALLSETFHYPAKVLVITPERLEEVIRLYPFQNQGQEFHRYAVFTEDGFEKELARGAVGPDETIEAVSPGNGVVYWRVLKGHTLDSTFGKYLSKAAGKHFVTNRNLNTLEKIVAKSIAS